MVMVYVTSNTFKFKGDTDRVIPKIEAKWGMGFDAWNFNLFGGYQYYSISDVTSLRRPAKQMTST